MRVLAMDTCGLEATVAVGEVSSAGATVLAEGRMPGRNASERLVGEVRAVLRRVGWSPRDVEAVVVVRGPGSFTGVRVGVSAAKGLAEATGARLLPVSRLAVLAGAVTGERVWALLEAGRGEMYCGEFVGGEAAGEGVRTAEEVRTAARDAGAAVVACEAAVMERMAGLKGLVEVRPPGAVEAMQATVAAVCGGRFADAAEVDALYLRRTEAEIVARLAEHAVEAGRG